MSEITQQTLVDLQLPTMSLVEKFCETPEEVKSFFAGMTAVYENAPTADNIRRIADKIKSRDSREQKQDWLRQELKQVSATARENAVEKYIKQKNAVPAGLPCSGDLLTYLDYVPRQAKDELLEAQAAARILSHLSEGRKDLKGTVISIGPDGMPKEAKEFLNKPFSTSIQRTEQIADFLCAYQNNEKQINLSQMHDDRLEALCRGDMPQDSMPEVAKALAECRKYAVQTLKKSAENIAAYYPKAASRINALAADYPETDNAPVNFALIARTAETAAGKSIAYYGTVISGADRPAEPGADSFNAAEAALFKEIIGKRNRQIQNAQVHLNILEHTQDIR